MKVALSLALLILLLLCSCRLNPFFDEEYSASPQYTHIRYLKWLPDNSGILAYIAEPVSYNNYDYHFRLYGTDASFIKDYPTLDNDVYYRVPYITSDSKYFLTDDYRGIRLFELATNAVVAELPDARLISYAPDNDRFLVYENQSSGGPYRSYSIYQIENGSLRLLNELKLLDAYYGSYYGFPLLLSAGNIASIEYDSSNRENIVIRDSLSVVQRSISLAADSYLRSAIAVRSNTFFAVIASNAPSNEYLCAFDIVSGNVDTLNEAPAYSTRGYLPLSDGTKIILQSYDPGELLILKDVSNKSETVIPMTAAVSTFALSSDDKQLAVVRPSTDGKDEWIEVLAMP